MTSVTPAGKSTAAPAGSFATIILAVVTQVLPGPNSLSHFGMDSVPYAMAAIACAPPTLKTRSIPALRAATRTAGSAVPWRVGGVHITRTGQPAMRGRHRQHDDGGGQRGGAGRHVQTDRAHRHADALAEHARRRLDAQGARLLRRVKRAHVTDRACRAPRAGRRSARARRRRTPARDTANASSRTPSKRWV